MEGCHGYETDLHGLRRRVINANWGRIGRSNAYNKFQGYHAARTDRAGPLLPALWLASRLALWLVSQPVPLRLAPPQILWLEPGRCLCWRRPWSGRISFCRGGGRLALLW